MFFWKIFKCVLTVSRILKWKRKVSLKQIVITIGVIGVISSLVSLFLYFWLKKTGITKVQEVQEVKQKVERLDTTESKRTMIVRPMKHVPLDEVYPEQSKEDVDSFEFVKKPAPMIDTKGCQIPVDLVPYNRTKNKVSCGLRAVFLKKAENESIKATIKVRVIKKYLRIKGTFDCCYKFFMLPKNLKDAKRKIKSTNCKPLKENVPIKLLSEFVNVKCFQYNNNTTYVIYNDTYAFVKKIRSRKPNVEGDNCKYKYNVLILGIDSLSLSRFIQTMRRTTQFLSENFWLGFRGFNKIERDSLPNVIAALTGLTMTDFNYKCANNMTICNELFAWTKFKDVGYVTAFGEDYLSLPEMFSNGFEFDENPTDHYMRGIFVHNEYTVNKSQVCTGRQTSGEQILNYALDFALTYRSDSFFGLFWINSFGHSIDSNIVHADVKLENFLNQLTYTGVLKNTFVILMSAHGLLVGNTRMYSASFYDERMPALFISPPSIFKGRNLKMFNSIVHNQARLITPFDIYETLITIKQVSTCEELTVDAESCPKCQSLTENIDTNRTCDDAGIHEKWCTCRKLYYIDVQNDYGVKSILHVVKSMQSTIKSIETQKCWTCSRLTLKKVIRMHFYYDDNKTNLFYVVVYTMSPGDMMYEATVAQRGGKFEMVGPVTLLSDLEGFGNCTTSRDTRSLCLCIKSKYC